jgi:hypothetical protein
MEGRSIQQLLNAKAFYQQSNIRFNINPEVTTIPMMNVAGSEYHKMNKLHAI